MKIARQHSIEAWKRGVALSCRILGMESKIQGAADLEESQAHQG